MIPVKPDSVTRAQGDDMDKVIRLTKAALKSVKNADGGGLRFNTGKNSLELIPPEWIWGIGMVLTRGAAKYAIRNWERGMKWSYPVGCAFRHLLKFVCGERYDPETGCHHLVMVAWNALALMTYDLRSIGENDLVGDLAWLTATATKPGPELQAIMDRAAQEGAKAAVKAKSAAKHKRAA